jgi:hypothetical protein
MVADKDGCKEFYSKKFSDEVIGAKWTGNQADRIQKTADRAKETKDF